MPGIPFDAAACMTDSGILAYGAYIPQRRLNRAVVVAANAWFNGALQSLAAGERAMSNWDEDSITMAVEACRDCLGSVDRHVVAQLLFASTTAPYADRLNAGVIKEALNLGDAIGALDVGGSQRAGTSALIQALQTSSSGGYPVVCVAADKRKFRAASEGELLNGDAAAALLVGTGESIARYIGHHSVTLDFVDHFRAADAAFDYGWEARWVRDVGYNRILAEGLKAGLRRFDLAPSSIDHLIVAVGGQGAPQAIAKLIGVRAESIRDTLLSNIGFTGVAHPLLLLAHTLETAKAGERIVLAGFGQGCDILAFEVTDAINRVPSGRGVTPWINRRKPETNYMKYLAHNGLLDLDKGIRAEVEFKQSLSALYRSRKTVLGLIGGRSRLTGAIQFPRSEIGVDAADHSIGTQEDHPLAETPARILTSTADHLCYSPDPPAYYGMIEFEGGGRMHAEFADADEESIRVGRKVRMVFRIKESDSRRQFTKYFWKAAPVSQEHA